MFEVFGSQFKIIRGIKPTVFEIWKDDTFINQSSHNKEYQKILEQNILKLNHKSFHQIVVLGSSSFIPFMQLSSQNRRDVIEDLLDINVFSKMNTILKEKNGILKDNIKNILHVIEILKTKIDAQRKYLRDIKALNKEQTQEKALLISDYQNEIKILQDKNKELSSFVEDNLDKAIACKESKESKKNELFRYKARFDNDIKTIVKEVKFFESNDICPSCGQDITDETKHQHVEQGKTKAKELQAAITQADDSLKSTIESISIVESVLNKCREYQSEINFNNQSIDGYYKNINRVNIELSNLSQATDLLAAENDLEQLKINMDSEIEKRLELNDQMTYNNILSEMLKDTGIKTKIVKQYLPVINKLCNQYLQILDFFVHFHLDEAFQETIRSRYRDSFSYESFSEGEKQRIDLALLFTWRQIAKMKNSVATNLLILDETFDSSLDQEGIDNLMKIIYSLDNDTNVFVISHKGEMLDGKFSKKIEIVKEKNFSKIKGT